MKKIWRVLSLMVLIWGGIGLLIQPASARELAQTDVVDSFKVTEKRLVQGQQTVVTVHFSAKADTKIQPADTLTFTMPQELMGITEQGDRTRQVPLGDLGEVAIFKDRVVVTFNDNVESLNGVRGNFNFGIETRRTEKKEPVVILTNFGTLLDPIEINVLGQRDPQQGEQRELPFFYKVGDQQGAANQIRWFLNVNLNKADLGSDITLRDTSGAGQTVNPDSFRILVDNTEARRELTLADFESQAYGKMHLQPSGMFDLTFNRDKARFTAFNVIYTTSLTQKGLKQKQLKNHYELHYEPITGPNKDEEGTAIVNNLFASGEANGDKFEKHADEVVEEQPVETVESIEPETIEPRVVEESVVEMPSEQAQVTQPEVHANEVVEEQPVETVEPIEPETIEPRVAEESVVETPSEQAQVTQPEVHANEVVEEQPVETVEPIEPEQVQPQQAEEKVVETPSEQAQVTQPEVHANEVVEEQPVETVEPIEPEQVQPQQAEEKVVETPSEQAQVTQPEVHANEVVEEQPVEMVEPIEPEAVQPQQAEEKVVETPSEQAQVTQPEVHANEVVEEQPVEMVEPIEPEAVQPQQAEEKVVETPTEQAEVTQPEVHANEVVEEQPVETVEPIEPEQVQPQQAEEKVVETPSEQAEVTQPEVHANEVVEEQPVETVEPIEPEQVQPQQAEEKVVETPTEQVEVTQPEVHANEVVEEQPVETVEPIEPEVVQPQQAEEKVVETPSEQVEITQPKNSEAHATLPKTGQNMQRLISFLGSILLLLGCIGYFKSRK